ncbi:hypothetical protein D9M72_471000 [compost metagenome]
MLGRLFRNQIVFVDGQVLVGVDLVKDHDGRFIGTLDVGQDLVYGSNMFFKIRVRDVYDVQQ